MGCPTNAKQSMLVTTIPVGPRAWRHLVTRARAERLVLKGDKVGALDCVAARCRRHGANRTPLRLRAKHFVLAGGAINSPALLLRSTAPDPHRLLGKRTFLHPTLISAGMFPQRVDGYAGAPQTVYSDHFLHTHAIDGALGYKLEAPPLHPLLLSTTMAGFGASTRRHDAPVPAPAGHAGAAARRLPRRVAGRQRGPARQRCAGARLSAERFHLGRRAPRAADHGRDPVRRRRKKRHAGARAGAAYSTWEQARSGINALPYKLLATRVASAHVMGGCGMSNDQRLGVTAQRPLSRAGQPVGARRFAVPDLDRRQSAVVDLRHRRAPGQRPDARVERQARGAANACLAHSDALAGAAGRVPESARRGMMQA
jgi:choline dehydrogenase-like flavoprotein